MNERIAERQTTRKISYSLLVFKLFMIGVLTACGGDDDDNADSTRFFNLSNGDQNVPGEVQGIRSDNCVEFNQPQAAGGLPYDPNKRLVMTAHDASKAVGAGLEDVTSFLSRSSGQVYIGNGAYVKNERGELLGARQGIPEGLPQGIPADNGDIFCLVEDK